MYIYKDSHIYWYLLQLQSYRLASTLNGQKWRESGARYIDVEWDIYRRRHRPIHTYVYVELTPNPEPDTYRHRHRPAHIYVCIYRYVHIYTYVPQSQSYRSELTLSGRRWEESGEIYLYLYISIYIDIYISIYIYIYLYICICIIQIYTDICIFIAIAELQAGINAKRADMERERGCVYM